MLRYARAAQRDVAYRLTLNGHDVPERLLMASDQRVKLLDIMMCSALSMTSSYAVKRPSSVYSSAQAMWAQQLECPICAVA